MLLRTRYLQIFPGLAALSGKFPVTDPLHHRYSGLDDLHTSIRLCSRDDS